MDGFSKMRMTGMNKVAKRDIRVARSSVWVSLNFNAANIARNTEYIGVYD